ncbi:MAG: N-acetyltransferase family protein, partial [Phycisphaerales bacterium]
MFRIRQLTPDAIPANRRLIDEAKAVLRERLPGLPEKEFDSFEDRLCDPLSHRMHAMLFVADNMRGKMLGFAYVSHATDLGFCLLDYIATPVGTSGGVGGAIYQRVREACVGLGVVGLFFECLPDDPQKCSDPTLAPQNAARLRFYERFGARPIVNTSYETPLKPGDLDMPHLVFDDLGSGKALGRDRAREIIGAVLERKYGDLCDASYIRTVVESITDDPVQLRPARPKRRHTPPPDATAENLIALVVNDQ